MKSIFSILEIYRQVFPQEEPTLARIEALMKNYQDCLLRSCVPGHITASTWILSPDGNQVLLTRHRKLKKWLQLGGHVDGEKDILAAALREAREESGLKDFEVIWPHGEGVPLDVDVHVIPARLDEPKHEHHDLRFLLRAKPDQSLVVSDESDDLAWFTFKQVRSLTREPSLIRMLDKTSVGVFS